MLEAIMSESTKSEHQSNDHDVTDAEIALLGDAIIDELCVADSFKFVSALEDDKIADILIAAN